MTADRAPATQDSGVTPTSEPLAIAYYCTGHGLGHATRAIEVCKHLVGRGHTVTVITGAPARVFLQEVPSARLVLRKAVLDAGAKQLDPFTVDVRGSLEQYQQTAVVNRDAMLEAEVQWLQSNHVDLVVSDVVPIVCAAAAAAGVPAVCVSNFSWDFIYSEYLTTLRKFEFRQLVWQIAQDYSAAALLLRLPGYVPMPAFTAIEDVPLVVRHARRTPQEVREELGLAPGVRLTVLIHGGHKAELDVREDFLPPGWVCVACNGGRPLGPKPLPPNFMLAPADVYTPDLVAASDCIIGKIGYGIVSECLAHARPLVFVRRDFFNEEPFLRKKLEVHNAAIEMKRRDFLEGHWGPYLLRACSMTVKYTDPTNGAEVVAARLEQVGRRQFVPPAFNPLARMKDTVVFGYLMASSKHGRVDVPDWYVNGADPNRRRMSYKGMGEAVAAPLKHWHLLEGNPRLLHQLPDTVAFLQLLHTLHAPPATPAAAAQPTSNGTAEAAVVAEELPEVRAARVLFRWDDEVLITRAPGRLDVMGGIADYSGSLVLQMPVAEACHVALQRHPVAKQKVWKHVQARHDKLGGPRPTLLVASLHADDTNRAPTLDMDLQDLFNPDGSPIPYESLRLYFQSDPAGRWGAYVAGVLLVLAHEKGARFPDGISILVASDVPEGKGVSSSAALEVAVMSAVAAAHGIKLGGRELALLCQKVEHLVVGAPCGVMDQMTAALGEAGQLTALLCQPAELQAGVQIPHQIRFWGIDSGIRHCVGGSDYRSVRVGAFIGLKLISQAHQRQQQLLSNQPSSSVAAVLTEVTSLTNRTPSPCTTPSPSGGGIEPRPALTGGLLGSGMGVVAAAAAATQAGSSSGGFFSGAAAAAAPAAPQQQQQQRLQQQLPPRPHHQQSGGGQSGSADRHSSSKGAGSSSSRCMPCSFGSHLANISPSEYRELYEPELPVAILGSEFLRTYGPHLDSATFVDPSSVYAVKDPTAHPVFENHRVNQFRALLAATEALAEAATAAAHCGSGSVVGGSSQQLSQVLSGSSVGATGSHLGPRGRHSYPGAFAPHEAGSKSGPGSSGEASSSSISSITGAGGDGAEGVGVAAGHQAAAAGVGAVTEQVQRLGLNQPHAAAAAAGGVGGGGSSDALAGGSSSGGEDDLAGSSSGSFSRHPSPFASQQAAADGGAAAAAAAGIGSTASSSSSSGLPGAIQGPLELLGELMLQSHASYTACGLGSDGTNRLVNIVRQHIMAARRAGVPPALYGAKITGGGSGGTVCVLGLSGPAGQAAIDAVAAQYREETGYHPYVFAGSSMGAVAFGHLRVKLRHEQEA